MKLTVSFLAALAVADARQARRQYGSYGSNPYGGGHSSVPAVEASSKPANQYGGGNGYGHYSAPPAEPTYNSKTSPVFPSQVSSVPAPVSSVAASYQFTAVPYNPTSTAVVKASSAPYDSYPKSSAPIEASSKASSAPYGSYSKSSAQVEASSKASSAPYGGYTPKSSAPIEASSKASSAPYGSYSKSSAQVEASSKASSAPYGTGYLPKSSSKGVFPSSGVPYPTGTGVFSKPIAGTTSCTAERHTSKVPVSETTKTITKTMVYTIGTGTSARAITTEITSVSTKTIYSTVIVTLPSKPSAQASYPVGGDDSTTTIKTTTTSTKYITVHATPSVPVAGAPSSPAYPNQPESPAYPNKPVSPASPQGPSYPSQPQGPSYPVSPEGSAPAACAPAITVTVTAQPVTVTAQPVTVTVTQGSGYPVSKPVEISSKGKPTNYPMPYYPIGGNSTYAPYPTSGFKTSTKGGSYSASAPAPVKPTSLPYFSFVSQPVEATSSAAYPSGGSKPSSSAPIQATSSPVGYGSGGYGAKPSSSKASSTPAPASKTPSYGNGYPAATPSGNGYGYGNYGY